MLFKSSRDRFELEVMCEFLLRVEGLTVALRSSTAVKTLLPCLAFTCIYNIFVSLLITSFSIV